jgi:osomolarity two-component system sensor histidine kinase SLN1
MTVPIANNTNKIERLGYLTVVLNSRLISQVTDSLQGLGNSGETLLLGPASRDNIFNTTVMDSTANDKRVDFEVRYVVPVNATHSDRDLNLARTGPRPPFNASDFPTIYRALSRASNVGDDASGSNVRATNEAGQKVSVGFASTHSPIVDWIVIVEQTRKEVWQPINQLRNVILACLFATAGLMALISFPLAHFASLPIIRLKQATLRSMDPPSASRSSFDSFASGRVDGEDGEETAHLDGGNGIDDALARKEGLVAFSNPVTKWRQKRSEASNARRDERKKRVFRIPGKVKERKHWVRDELSELTQTFNEMSDELMMQYTKLEERVQQRTHELELSKKAAEAANESKTLFIANLSHELKTPLNGEAKIFVWLVMHLTDLSTLGILGLSAVCMQEDDPLRLKRSLGIIYKSGDLLLHLLNDLLTFR